MQHIHHAPRHVAEQIWIAGEKDGSHSKHHEYTGEDHRQAAQHYDAMIELVLQWIFGKFPRQPRRFSNETIEALASIFQIGSVWPDRPEIQVKRGVNNVKQ